MATFPTVRAPLFPIKIKEVRPVHRTSFEANYQQVIRKAVRSRRIWTTEWKNSILLTSTEFNLIRTFFNSYQGEYFDWVHPYTSVTHSVTFNADELNYDEELISYKIGTPAIYYSLSLELSEA